MIDLAKYVGRFKVIYADPAWEYEGDPDKPQAAGKHYNTMSYEELKALPVRQLIDDPGVICVWATGPKLHLGVDLIRDWGFHYRGIGYIWVKTTNAGKIIEGQGIRPSFTKPTTELILIGSTEPEGRTLPIYTESQGQLIFAPRPGGIHSRKPEEARWRIEELFGDVPKLEMFARAKYPGWEAWGLESDKPMPAIDAESPKLKARLEREAELASQRELLSLMDLLPQEEF